MPYVNTKGLYRPILLQCDQGPLCLIQMADKHPFHVLCIQYILCKFTVGIILQSDFTVQTDFYYSGFIAEQILIYEFY